MAKKKTKAARRPKVKRKNQTRGVYGSIASEPPTTVTRIPTLASVMDDLKAIGDRASGLIV